MSAAAPTGFPSGLEVALVGGPPTLAREVVKVLRGEGIEVWVADTLDGLRDVCGDRRPHVAVQLSAGPLTARSRLLASVSRHRDRVRVVLVRGGIRDAELRAALDAGVAGVVMAGAISAALGPCLRAVCAGQVCVPAAATRPRGRPLLSTREKQILGLVVMGYMNTEIAAQLFVAESTVKSHLSSAFAKLGVHSRHEAADLILDPKQGLTLGILALGAEPVGDAHALR